MKTTKYFCQSCAMWFIVDKDFKHNVNCCPYCFRDTIKEVRK